MPSNKFCVECGQGILSDSLFCQYCGAKQSNISNAQVIPAQSKQQLIQPEPKLDYPKATLGKDANLNLLDYPSSTASSVTKMTPNSELLIFARDFFDEWVNVFYQLPTGEGAVGWVEVASLDGLVQANAPYLVENLLLSFFPFNQKHEVISLRQSYIARRKNLDTAFQKQASDETNFRAGCIFSLVLLIIAMGGIISASDGIIVLGFLGLILALIVGTFASIQLGKKVNALKAKQEYSMLSQEIERLQRIIISKTTPREIELQDFMTRAAFSQALSTISNTATHIAKSEYNRRRFARK